MAGTQVNVRPVGRASSEDMLYQLAVQVNKIVVDLEVLRAALDTVCDKLDADAGVTDTNYAATANVATAAALTAAKLGDRTGTALS